MKHTIPVLMLIALLSSTSLAPNVWADGHGKPSWDHDGHHDEHAGHWDYGWHNGRLGWLWVVGSAILLYNVTRPAPIPQAPTVIVQTAPPAAPATAYWYFCPSSGSYYPYVQTCPDGWETVSAPPPPSY